MKLRKLDDALMRAKKAAQLELCGIEFDEETKRQLTVYLNTWVVGPINEALEVSLQGRMSSTLKRDQD